MNVVSMFDGISCGMVALERARIPVEKYVAYEIEPDAIKVSKKNYPQIEHRGNVCDADFSEHRGIDLLIGGSPCQDFSTLSRTRNGLSGKKSGLFWEFARAWDEIQPRWFLFENNVSMPQEAEDTISEVLGCRPIAINSSLVSGQMRNRFYWTNIPNVTLPNDKHIDLRDLIKSYPYYTEIELADWTRKQVAKTREKYGYIPYIFCPYSCGEITDKHYCLTAQGNSQTKTSTNMIYKDGRYYMLNADFWEILQTLPLGYTSCLGKENKRKTVIGNGWTVDVIAHIFTFLGKEN